VPEEKYSYSVGDIILTASPSRVLLFPLDFNFVEKDKSPQK